jgi:beta-lactam-binding protein with PASTA domain
VTLAASAASGSTFTGWSGGGCSGTGSCVVTINADTAVTATFDSQAVVPPPVEPSCVVPKLKGKALGQAKSVLKAAHCTLGKVTKPKAKKGKKTAPLVVKSSKPGAGATLSEGAKVGIKLGPKPKKKKK